ncbi:MAG TPA: hypothetical protein VEW46_02875 [Pyrinomonadaceae bacterium]|nr:hypothetical protein [Pyrinomonadaceae bacterium]
MAIEAAATGAVATRVGSVVGSSTATTHATAGGTGEGGTSSSTTGEIIAGGVLDPGIVVVGTASTMTDGGIIALTVDVRVVTGHEICAGDETNFTEPSA